MIPMSCPSCGRRGTIPPDRLMTRMHCKKCDAVFYMDAGGRLTLGEPPVEKPKAGKKGEAKRSYKEDDPLEPLKHIPKSFYWAVAAAFLGLIIWSGWGTFNSIFTGLPNGLQARAEYFAKAFIDKDWKKMKKLVRTKAGEEALLSWVMEARQYYPDVDPEQWGDPVIEYNDTLSRVVESTDPMQATLPQEDQNAVQSYVRIIPPVGADGKATAATFMMVVDWTKEGSGWWINGEATYGNVKASGANKSF